MQVEQLIVPKEKVEKEYQAFKDLVACRKTEYLATLHKVYGHMRHGKTVIDIYTALKTGSVTEAGNPKLAICRAHSPEVVFEKELRGGGRYYHRFRQNPFGYGVELVTAKTPFLTAPAYTFPLWVDGEGKVAQRRWDIKNQRVSAPVPPIPASILAPIKGKLTNYHILWEVDQWKPIPPRDPMLLKQIDSQFFIVLASWDLTALERSVIRTRLM